MSVPVLTNTAAGMISLPGHVNSHGFHVPGPPPGAPSTASRTFLGPPGSTGGVFGSGRPNPAVVGYYCCCPTTTTVTPGYLVSQGQSHPHPHYYTAAVATGLPNTVLWAPSWWVFGSGHPPQLNSADGGSERGVTSS